MNSESASKSIDLQREYLGALKKYLAGGPRTSLLAAGKLGRRAVTAGIGTTALARMHKRALLTLVPAGETSRTTQGKLARAGSFFIAALAPMDGTRRAVTANNGRLARLKELKETMRRSTVELTGTQRQLKRELTRRKKLEAALEKSRLQYTQLRKQSVREHEHLRRLSRQIISAQEDERKRVSRELHDEIGQTLTAINVNLAKLKAETNINAKALKRTILKTQRLIERSMKTVHKFARDLRPPLLDDLGLIPALHGHLNAFTKQTTIPVRFTAFAAVETMDAEKRTVLYRVAQEAFANIAKHARASLVTMTIRRSEHLVAMVIHDNGRGFDMKRWSVAGRRTKRLGLLGMRERLEMVGGSFEIESTPDHGTTIRAQLPFDGRKTRPRTGAARRRK